MIVTGDTKIFAAFVKARAEIGATVTKDGKGNYGKYATLAALTEATAAAMAKHGLAVVQEASVDEIGATIETWIVHELGGMMQFAPLTLPVSQRNAQAVGSAITYCRRYALAAICGIAPEDDDGQAAANAPATAQKPAERTQARATGKQAAPARNASPGPATDGTGVDVDVIFARDIPWYVDARNNLPAAQRKIADEYLTLHRDNHGPCSDKQYNYLAGLLDSIIEQATGAADGHKRVLSVLCQMDVSQANVPSGKTAGRLLARLATHIKDAASGTKIANPDYDQATADAMVAIYRAAEQVGTPSLLDESEIRY